jgi:hypothetical protein
MKKLAIHEPIEEIALAYDRWRRNRDFLTGEDAVKLGGSKYLPKLADPNSDNGLMSDADYKSYIKRIPFFAGAARVKDGLKGLIFRKPPVVELPAGLEAIFDTITPAGHTFNDLAEDIVDEALTTGFTGMLIDHPEAVDGLTMANAVANGFRPFIAVYAGESIREVTTAVVGNVQKIVRVRLMDDDETVRELLLDEGIYKVIMHRKDDNNTYVADAPIMPLKKGQPLNDIPFVLVAEKPRHCLPRKGPLDDVVLANLHCYLEGADAKNSRFYSSAPILWISGAEPIKNLVISPGAVIQTPESSQEKPVSIEYVEFSGAGQDTLEKAYQNTKEEMAMLGLRMLATESKGVEAAETHAIRRASENSILASLARRISDRLQEAANWVAWWMDVSEKVTVNLNTDFVPETMDAQEMTIWTNSVALGLFSRETVWDAFIDGGKLPEDFDKDAEKQRIDGESLAADKPTAAPAPQPNPGAAPTA